ncbi:MAG: hypothetical protein QXR25_03080 [Candidatus Nitrosocaldus sp.]
MEDIAVFTVLQKPSGSLLPDTKVTKERVGEYQWTRSSSTASYSFSATTGFTYLMAAMKNGYKYVDDWNVNAPATKDWSLPTRNYTDVKFVIVTDEEYRNVHIYNHEADATYTALKAAEPWFKEEHGIQLIKYEYRGDFISDSSSCTSIGEAAKARYPRGSVQQREMIIIVVGQSSFGPSNIWGCAQVPTIGGTYPYVVVRDGHVDPGRIAMHEISHAFGLSHTYGDRYGNPATDFYTVMHKYADDFMQIKNWAPHEDRTMEERRNWYPY